ncbi:MAG: hypothetical protein V7641_3699 [Blastocatellia bacterium]
MEKESEERGQKLDRLAMGCKASGAIWSAVSCHRCAAFDCNKAATSRRTQKQAPSPMPYTDLKSDLEQFSIGFDL